MWVTIQDGDDSLQHLLVRVLGAFDEQLVQELIRANNLDPPYVSTDTSFIRSAPAVGSVTVTLTGSWPLTVPSGTVITASSGPSGESRTYTTDSSVTLSYTGQQATVGVTCTLPGPQGNVGPNRLTQWSVVGATVTNPAPVTGGYALHVLGLGDPVWIPEPDRAIPGTVKERLPLDRVDQAGGIGWLVTPMGGFLWGEDDLATAEGANEIAMEVIHRLRSPHGSVEYAPTEGSYLPAIKGSSGSEVYQEAELLATSDALQDDRVSDAVFQAEPYANGWILLRGTLTLASGGVTPVEVHF